MLAVLHHKKCQGGCKVTIGPDVYRCEAKGKTININIPRPLCTLFELKKENQDEKGQA